MAELECGTCGDSRIVVESVDGRPWSVSCGNGHAWVLTLETARIVMQPDTEGER